MGRLDFLRRGKKTKQVADKTYILTRKNEKTGGMEKVLDLAKNMTPDELYPSLTAGIYAVHIYSKGQTGFDAGPMFEVEGEVGEKPEEGAVKRSPLSAMKEQMQGLKDMKDDMKEFFTLFGDMFADKKVTMEDAMGYFKTLKEHKETLDGLFPGVVTGDKDKIPLSGTIPAWMAFVPQVIDQSADALERRLVRWGLVEPEGIPTMSKDEDPIKLPEKPKVVTVKKEEKKKEEDKEILIELPPKPVVKVEKKDEVREAVIEEEKEEGEEEDGGEGTEQ